MVHIKQQRHLAVYTREEVARHRSADDAWIIVRGVVYDITPHIRALLHKEAALPTSSTQLASTLAHLGSDCSEEFAFIHGTHIPEAHAQLPRYRIGVVQQDC